MPDFDENLVNRLAKQFKILGDVTRLKILMLLKNGELPVHEIVEKIKTTQANISKHLKILYENNIVKKRQVKSSVFYSIKRECIFDICDILNKADKSPLDASIKIMNRKNYECD